MKKKNDKQKRFASSMIIHDEDDLITFTEMLSEHKTKKRRFLNIFKR